MGGEERKRKGLRRKLAEFLIQNADEDQNKKRTFLLIGRVFGRIMVSHHKMVSPQNGDTRGGPPSFSYATEASVLLLFIDLNYRANFHILLMAKLFAAFVTSFLQIN